MPMEGQTIADKDNAELRCKDLRLLIIRDNNIGDNACRKLYAISQAAFGGSSICNPRRMSGVGSGQSLSAEMWKNILLRDLWAGIIDKEMVEEHYDDPALTAFALAAQRGCTDIVEKRSWGFDALAYRAVNTGGHYCSEHTWGQMVKNYIVAKARHGYFKGVSRFGGNETPKHSLDDALAVEWSSHIPGHAAPHLIIMNMRSNSFTEEGGMAFMANLERCIIDTFHLEDSNITGAGKDSIKQRWVACGKPVVNGLNLWGLYL